MKDILMLSIGFAIGSFLYLLLCTDWDWDGEPYKIIHCKDCLFCHKFNEENICELCRVTSNNEIVNIYTMDYEFCKYAVRKDDIDEAESSMPKL